MKSKILLTLAASALISPLFVSCDFYYKKTDSACETIKEDYKKYVYINTNVDAYKDKTPAEIMREIYPISIGGVETYYFKDIDYKTDNVRSSWKAADHLSRALKIAICAEEKDSDYLRDIAKKLTYHWVYSNYHNINWWQNELGANSTLANLGLFTFDYLGKKGQDAFNGKIRESSLKYRPSLLTHTGANVIDYIDITCRDAAINNDKEEMDLAFNRLKDEISNDKIEGFQKDGSFFQHGRQVQNVSYGKAVIRLGKTLYHLRNVKEYSLNEDKMKILTDYILNGLRESTFKGYTNYTTVSREHSRPNNLDTQANGLGELSYMLTLDYYPVDKKKDTFDFIESLQSRTSAIKENKITYFPVAKMVTANIGGVYMSYKSTEPNLTNTECVNGENQLGLNLSYGTNTCVMDNGDEYFNIAPVMNYNYMPGTTSVFYGDQNKISDLKQQDTAILNAVTQYGDGLFEHKVPSINKGDYVYNDGQNEDITYFMTKTRHHDRANYTVTCFVNEDGMVLLGSDFSYENKKDETQNTSMHTTIDQYITKDNPSTKSDISILNHDEGNIIYRSLDGKQLTKTIEKRTFIADDWKRNNRDLNTKDLVAGEKNVSTITIDDKDIKSYAYAIQPKASINEFKFITNKDGIHAIELPNGKIAAAFYNKNKLSFEYNSKTYSIKETDFIKGKGAFKIF